MRKDVGTDWGRTMRPVMEAPLPPASKGVPSLTLRMKESMKGGMGRKKMRKGGEKTGRHKGRKRGESELEGARGSKGGIREPRERRKEGWTKWRRSLSTWTHLPSPYIPAHAERG